MTRALFLDYPSAVTIPRVLPDAGGDHDLCYVEFATQLNKKEYSIRIAALHIHIAARSRTASVKERLLEEMLELYYSPDVEDSLYLAPLDWLFVDQPAFMKAREFGYVEVVREKEPDLCVVRVFPVALHLAGPFAGMVIKAGYEDEVFYPILPVRQPPQKPHECRQQRAWPVGVDGERRAAPRTSGMGRKDGELDKPFDYKKY